MISIIGSGNWATTIACLLAKNNPQMSIRMWCRNEMIIDNRSLADWINIDRQNIKYLPSVQIPKNVSAHPLISDATSNCRYIVFCVPHQYIQSVVDTMQPIPGAIGMSLIKGEGISQIISTALDLDVCVMMGANIASEVAQGYFAESTIGCNDLKLGAEWRSLFHSSKFVIDAVTTDLKGVEIMGTLKNVIALAAGFTDGLKWGWNSKASVIRRGIHEMIELSKELIGPHPDRDSLAFLSCGIADLICSSCGGRNRSIAERMVTGNTTWEEEERLHLNGQKLQGPETAITIGKWLAANELEQKFPFFCKIREIVDGESAYDTLFCE